MCAVLGTKYVSLMIDVHVHNPKTFDKFIRMKLFLLPALRFNFIFILFNIRVRLEVLAIFLTKHLKFHIRIQHTIENTRFQKSFARWKTEWFYFNNCTGAGIFSFSFAIVLDIAIPISILFFWAIPHTIQHCWYNSSWLLFISFIHYIPWTVETIRKTTYAEHNIYFSNNEANTRIFHNA